MRSLLRSVTNGRTVLLLGYGREGHSSLRLLNETCPGLKLTVADADASISIKNPELQAEGITVQCGEGYLDNIGNFDLILKSPGISLKNTDIKTDPAKISSQTDLFLRAYSSQITGVTGTKGKSTTSSLIYHIVRSYTSNTLLAGNIGIPLFDLVPEINPETRIICELSSHQLEYIRKGPHIAVLLNLFQEHLDHYNSFYDYQMAKFQSGLKQTENDWFIWTSTDENTRLLLNQNKLKSRRLPVYLGNFEGNGIGISGDNIVLRVAGNERILMPTNPESMLKGTHNLINISVAAAAAALMSIPAPAIQSGIRTFLPLEHRIEYVGNFGGKNFYNDSISTIPEATIAAVKTLKQVDTLILGGFDRGIDYNILTGFLNQFTGIRAVFTGPAGKRMMEELNPSGNKNAQVFISDFREAVAKAIDITPIGGTCLLSPAASSYDCFKNFEERGRCFKELVENK
ncbi:MAG: UDP-N-acetylmuramoyl-L-alanine--D-glutamate ligase [Bacteroidales bacterium]|nr:UDP-N-acetylmuramoyl-L-alanine--D-glutamate ligase [Bacteroidales bacterium]